MDQRPQIPKEVEERIHAAALAYQEEGFDEGSDYGDTAREAYKSGAEAEYVRYAQDYQTLFARFEELKALQRPSPVWVQAVDQLPPGNNANEIRTIKPITIQLVGPVYFFMFIKFVRDFDTPQERYRWNLWDGFHGWTQKITPELLARIEWLDDSGAVTDTPFPEHKHVALPSGAVANVSPNASPELLRALNNMTELAKGAVTETEKLVPPVYKGWDSHRLIGRVKDRFNELLRKGWDWRSFYNGWIEGRSGMLDELKEQWDVPATETEKIDKQAENLTIEEIGWATSTEREKERSVAFAEWCFEKGWRIVESNDRKWYWGKGGSLGGEFTEIDHVYPTEYLYGQFLQSQQPK